MKVVETISLAVFVLISGNRFSLDGAPGQHESSGMVKVAYVGAGYMAKEHIKAFADMPEVALAGIYSRTRERAEGLASISAFRLCAIQCLNYMRPLRRIWSS